MTNALHFEIDCEWLCNLIRDRVYYEGLPYSSGISLLEESFGISPEICDDILRGKKIIRGVNEGELVEDNRYSEYQDYIKKQEVATVKLAIENDILIHPLNYVDPFATYYSYWAFDKIQREKKKINEMPCTVQDVLEFFVYHTDYITGQINDLSNRYLKGGCYCLEEDGFLINNNILSGPVESPVEFWDALYNFFEKKLADMNWLSKTDREDIIRRQNNHLAWKRAQQRRLNRSIELDEIVDKKIQEHREQKFESRPCCDFLESAGDLVRTKTKYVPTEKFYSYGLISPEGDFYACKRACHESAAYMIARQNGWLDIPEDAQDFIIINQYDIAKDMVFEKGFTFVNTQGACTLYNKWGMDYEQMPQKAIDACFDWIQWDKEN